jgi:MFS family permease
VSALTVDPGTRAMFRSLRVRNYRLFAGGQVVSLTGTWAQRIAQDWLVLELSGDSGLALGIVTGLQFLPVLLLGMWGGVLADRYDKRTMLVVVQVAMGVLALALGLLDVTGAVQLWHVYALSFALGIASAFDTPVRQSFIVELVGADDLPNAVSLNSATFNSARIIGPAIAGVLIGLVGTGWIFLGNAVSYVAVLAGLLLMRAGDLHSPRRVEKAKGQVREGLSYVRHRPDLLVPILLVAVIGTFGLNFQITMALVAKQVFGHGAGQFALLTSMLALGSLLVALASARRTGPPRVRRLLLSALAFGLLEVLVGLSPTYAVMAVLLVPTGIAVLSFTTTANTLLQLGSAPHVRGRVMALYALVFLGGTPVGAPLIGALAEVLGPRSGLLIGGTVSALAALGGAVYLTRARSLTLEPHLLRRHPHVHVRV